MLGNGKRIWQPTAMQERKSLRMNKEQKQFLLSSLFSGIMIGIGCTVYLSCVNKLVGALLFCAGLFFILTNGGTLFTGICGLKTPVKKLAWVFVLNGLGTVIPAIVSWSNVVDGATKLGATAAAVMLGKLSMNPVSWLLNGLMCGVLMYLAVIGYKKAKTACTGLRRCCSRLWASSSAALSTRLRTWAIWRLRFRTCRSGRFCSAWA